MAFKLPPLPYDFSALEPAIDAKTMELHHDKHHQAYVDKLNEALEPFPELQKKTAEELVANLSAVPEQARTAVRNHGGGHVNHSMFWTILTPSGSGNPIGAVSDAIDQVFGNLTVFQEKFNDAGAKHFGSGWVWLARHPDGKLQIVTTPNQDNPLTQGLFPILGNDVWEHAYYLKYQNRRAEYLKAWWSVVNWTEVNKRFEESLRYLKKIAA